MLFFFLSLERAYRYCTRLLFSKTIAFVMASLFVTNSFAVVLCLSLAHLLCTHVRTSGGGAVEIQHHRCHRLESTSTNVMASSSPGGNSLLDRRDRRRSVPPSPEYTSSPAPPPPYDPFPESVVVPLFLLPLLLLPPPPPSPSPPPPPPSTLMRSCSVSTGNMSLYNPITHSSPLSSLRYRCAATSFRCSRNCLSNSPPLSLSFSKKLSITKIRPSRSPVQLRTRLRTLSGL